MLEPPLRERPCSDRCGASDDDHVEGLDSEPMDEPDGELDIPPPLLLDPELLLLPLSPPRGADDPPASPPPRGADSPVVFPLDVRCAAAVAGNQANPLTANAIVSVLTNLCLITPPTADADGCLTSIVQQICQRESFGILTLFFIFYPTPVAACPFRSSTRPLP